MTLVVLQAPPALPVTLALLKQHARIDHDHENELLSEYLAAATGEIEAEIGRALVQRRLQLRIDRFCDVIELPRPPCCAVESIKYLDVNGAVQTLAAGNYRVTGRHGDGQAEIARAPGKSWPVTQAGVKDAIRITFIAGYPPEGSPPDHGANVPAPIKLAIMELAATRYQWREAVSAVGLSRLPEAARRSLDAFRVWSF